MHGTVQSEEGIALHLQMNKGWLCACHRFSYLLLLTWHQEERGRVCCSRFFRSSDIEALISSQGLVYSYSSSNWYVISEATQIIAKKAQANFYHSNLCYFSLLL